MAIIVQKFGGKSLMDPDRIRSAVERILERKHQGHGMVVVVSAMGSTTDALIQLAKQVNPDPHPREMDMLLATGEQVSIALVAMALQAKGHDAVSFTGAQVGIRTDAIHMKAKIKDIRAERLKAALEKGQIAIVAGFQGVTDDEAITTLGRGGSDTTAVALAAVLKAELCEIFTDVEGVYTADPHIVPDARKIERMSYDEMMELASLGAKVLQYRAVEFAKKYKVRLVKRSASSRAEGTLICEEVEQMEDIVVSGAALSKDEAKITLVGVSDRPGTAAKIFRQIASRNIVVDMIIQNRSRGGFTDLTFTVPRTDLKETVALAETLAKAGDAKEFLADDDVAKVSIVGIGMRSHCGIAERMFQSLADEKINIDLIATSEIKISVVIRRKDGEKALRAVHKAFDLGKGAGK